MVSELFLKVEGGLCNRMRTLISAIGYCEKTDRTLKLCWPVSKKFHRFRRMPPQWRFEARFDDLWDFPVEIISEQEWEEASNAYPKNLITLPPPDISLDSPLLLHTCHAFYESSSRSPKELAHFLAPAAAVAARIEKFEKDNPSDLRIAVQIRTNAVHEKSAEFSPVSWFEDRISFLKTLYPSAIFLPVADSPTIFKRLHAIFGDSIVEQCKPPGYNTRRALQKALADLYIMGKSDYIVGTYFSSFSYMASTLQGDRGYEDSKISKGNLPERVLVGTQRARDE